MLNVLKTLFLGASARAEEQLTDHLAIDLIEQKIRESEGALSLAKSTLAALIIRQRNETQTLSRLETQIADLETRARQALAAGREDLAADVAAAIASLENERAVRRDTLDQLANRVARTQASVEKANRRIIDLRQGMISARAADAERKAQKSLNRSIGNTSAIRPSGQRPRPVRRKRGARRNRRRAQPDRHPRSPRRGRLRRQDQGPRRRRARPSQVHQPLSPTPIRTKGNH